MIENFNLDNWPIVYFKSNSENNTTFDDNNFEEFKKFYLELLIRCKRNKEKMILVCNLMDITYSDKIPMKYLLKHAQFNKEIYKFNKEYVTAVCLLCENKSLKNMINLYFSMTKPASPFKMCRSFKKGNMFLKEKCGIDYDLSIFQTNFQKINDEDEDDNNIDETSDNMKELEIEYEKINLDENYNKDKYSELL